MMFRMHKQLVTAAAIATLVLFGLPWGNLENRASVGPQAALARTTLKAQFFLPKGHPLSKRLERIYQDIEKQTGGEVKITSFYASELVPLRQALEGLSKGTLDLLVGPGNYYSGKVAIGDISIMPLNFLKFKDRARAFYDEGVGAILDSVYSKLGVTIQAPYNYFSGEVVLVRKGVKVNSYEDLKGLKLRVAGGELVEMVKAMGAQPAFIAPPEMYTALQRGTVDGAIFPNNDLVLLKLHEVASTVIGPDYLFSGPMMHFFMFNKKRWEQLPAGTREKISAVLKKAAYHDDAVSEQELVVPYREQAEKAGVKFITLSKKDINRAMGPSEVAWKAYLKYNADQGHEKEARKVKSILDRLNGLK